MLTYIGKKQFIPIGIISFEAMMQANYYRETVHSGSVQWLKRREIMKGHRMRKRAYEKTIRETEDKRKKGHSSTISE